MGLENRIKESFLLAKKDIAEVKSKVTELNTAVQEVLDANRALKGRLSRLKSLGTVAVRNLPVRGFGPLRAVKRRKLGVIGALNSRLVHDPDCPFAKRIQPKNKVVFSSKAKAINTGHKLCECLKRT